MAHIYASRSAPLWRDSALGTWFSAQTDLVLEEVSSSRQSLSKLPIPSEWSKQVGKMPLWLVRHAFLSESFMGWIPPAIATKLGHAFDPLPPVTSITQYDNAYYSGVRVTSRDIPRNMPPELEQAIDDILRFVMLHLRDTGAAVNPADVRRATISAVFDMINSEAYRAAETPEQRSMQMMQVSTSKPVSHNWS